MTKIKKTQTDTNNLPNKHSMEKGLSVCVTDLVALAHSMQFIKIHVSAAWTKNIATFRSDKQAKNDSINWPLHVKIKGVQHKLQELMINNDKWIEYPNIGAWDDHDRLFP